MINVQICVALFSVIVILGNIKTESVTTRINVYKKFKTSHNDTEITASSRLECVVKCLNIENCLAIRFSANTKTCIIINQRIMDITGGGEDDNVIIIRSAPGLHVLKKDYQRYAYTYTEAVNACKLLGSHLMTIDELQKVLDDGYSYCSCGWLAGGIRRYPMQTAKNGCGNTKGIVHCDWASKANAWCMQN